MRTIKTQLFIHNGFDDKPFIATDNMRSYGFVLLGTHDVEVPVPEVDFFEAEIESLKEQAAEALDKALALQKKAEKLKGGKGE